MSKYKTKRLNEENGKEKAKKRVKRKQKGKTS